MDLILDLCITEVTESFANHLERRERGNLEKRENFENIPLILFSEINSHWNYYFCVLEKPVQDQSANQSCCAIRTVSLIDQRRL